ncbi:FliM/FliN family flagellar motor switch protein [Occallatibacter savannae]|uniref:FliM/FliN family flagellar motor switch protein n=1 Tax=Occallatibacter savannae TaxID=1002691 RepID=UPI000D68D3FC|nr:FliM/FliN family flagellar motor switch protein [Occallatibacter savannae]
MNTFLDCWISVAGSLLPQALAGEPSFVEASDSGARPTGELAFTAQVEGEVEGRFTVSLDALILEAALLGQGPEQTTSWGELLREVAEAAAGELLATAGKKCQVTSFSTGKAGATASRVFQLKTTERSWCVSVYDGLTARKLQESGSISAESHSEVVAKPELSPGVELLLDVELEAALRFGCCEMPLGEILELGPGDVVELDRQVTDPVDLIVGNKIVARGAVVLVDGNFGLRVTEVAAPQKRLESIRCLF